MPAKKRIHKEEILKAALSIVRERGAEALNARSVATKLASSTQPIYRSVGNMSMLLELTLVEIEKIYNSYLEEEINCGKYPPYKSLGMGYIRFAAEEPKLFQLLFMRHKASDDGRVDGGDISAVYEEISRQVGISVEAAQKFHLALWVCVHGVATMYATSYLSLDRETVSAMITDIYNGLCLIYKEK